MTWIKSSFCSSDGCVECDTAGVVWRKALASTSQGQCVEAGCTGDAHFMRSRESFSNGNCAEVACSEGLHFVTSSASGANGDCVSVETTAASGEVFVRDSKDPQGPHLHFSAATWDDGHGIMFTAVPTADVPEQLIAARILAVVSAQGEAAALDAATERWYSLTDTTDTLWFTRAEVDAFECGVRADEFALA